MKMSRPGPGRRRAACACAPRAAGGFSLVELLVVILILAILFVVGGRGITRAWKRQKTQAMATDLKVFFQRAYTEMQRRGRQVFVQMGPLASGAGYKYLPFYLVADENDNGQREPFFNAGPIGVPLSPGADYLIDEIRIPFIGNSAIAGTTGVDQEFSFSTDDVTLVQTNLWTDQFFPCPPAKQPFCDIGDLTRARGLMVDFQGRAHSTSYVPGVGAQLPSFLQQLPGPAIICLTHVDTVSGSLMPPTRYLITVNPVWSVRIQKQIRDSSGVWVDQLGG